MNRRQLLLGMGATAGGGGIVSSGAFTSVEADRTVAVAVADDPDAFLRIGPCTDDNGDPTPNSNYAQFDGGTFTLDLTGANPNDPPSGGGVNANAVSRFDDVFEIRNQGTQPIGTWLETATAATTPDGDPKIEFYRSDDTDSDIVAEGSDLNAKCLNVGESICIGFKIRTESDDEDEEDLFSGSFPGANNEELVVNGDVNVACDVPDGGTGGSTDALYLADTGEGGGLPDGQTTLYEVSLSTGPNEASLTELIQQDSGNFTQVDSLAATPDGDSLYLYDKNSGYLGRYDVASGGSFTEIGQVANDPGGIVLGEFSPDGELWVASQQDNTLYTVDDIDSSPSVDTEEGIQVDVAGADVAFAFTPDSVLYLWSSADSDEGLYEIDITATNPTAQAITPSPSDIDSRQLTGLALKNPLGSTLLGSDKQQNEIVEIDTSTGLIGQTYDIQDQNEEYILGFGDMASPSSVSVD